MAEIEKVYKFLKYKKTELVIYDKDNPNGQVLIGGNGSLKLAYPSPQALNFCQTATPSSGSSWDNQWNVQYKDFMGKFGSNLATFRQICHQTIVGSFHPYVLLYVVDNGGLKLEVTSGFDRYGYSYLFLDVYIFYKQNGAIISNKIDSLLIEKTHTSFNQSTIGFISRNNNGKIEYSTYTAYRGHSYDGNDGVSDRISVYDNQYNNGVLLINYVLPGLTDTYNPYEDGGDSEDGGGEGDFDNTSEDIDVPNLPSLSATSSGFVNIFTPTLNQLSQLASFMWTTDFYDNIVKLWADPMSVILGLSIVPVNIPVDDVREVKCGNVSTGVSMYHASTQFVIVDCGTINVNEYWGAYLDYSPYTKIQLYLPYCGTHSLDIDDIMGRSINVTYHIDILSGSCVAFVKSTGKGLNSVLYEFSGNVSTQIPVTGENFSRLIQTAISSVASLGSTVATGGLSAPVTISTMGSLANNVANSKPEIERSGSMSGSTGLMGIQKPYLILTRPKQCIPKNVQKFKGFPSMQYKKLSEVEGFTIVSEILLKNITASDEEITEIKNLLKEGVIL